MALTAVQPAMSLEEKQSVHPFFSRPPTSNAPESKEHATEPSADKVNDDPDYELKETGAQKVTKKRGRMPGSKKKVKTENGPSTKKQPSLEQFTRRLNGDPAEQNGQDAAGESSLEVDLNQTRRKRRKTASPKPTPNAAVAADNVQLVEELDWHTQLYVEAGMDPKQQSDMTAVALGAILPTDTTAQLHEDLERPITPPKAPSDIIASNVTAETIVEPHQPQKVTPKKKVLKVNKNGKLLSSPPVKPKPESTTPRKRRTRKTSKTKTSSNSATVIEYGHDAASRKSIGEKIELILNGEKTARRPATPKKMQPPPKPVGPPKSTHPFFLGKAASKDDTAPSIPTTEAAPPPSPKTQKRSAVTPGKLRTESLSYHSNPSMPVGLGIGHTRTSRPGIGEAPWPSHGTAHVRDLETDPSTYSVSTTRPALLKDRKLKRSLLTISEEENLMTTLARQLRPSIRGRTRAPVSDFEPPRDVRLPSRLLTTGANVQDKLRSQVRAALPPSGVLLKEKNGTHSAVQTLFFDIENTLTPFDLGKCETQSWVTKYAPKHANHVLQSGEETAVLSDWLSNLMVLAVEKKLGNLEVPAVKKPPKKKRKKAEDDFIVDSDEEEEEEWVELAFADGHGQSTGPKSLRRQRWTRNKNVVLVSGPSGCGKSAMVHAVAKDLGFEVFEINSGSRRSGKDIQDKVGDMSENHLVNHKRHEVSNKQDIVPADDTDTERQNLALKNDIASGRQSTMAAFFKSSGPGKPKPKPKLKASKPSKSLTSAQATLPVAQAQRKSQKQSLILFEEADILFEEDQQFWAHVTKLASQSKRPIVITCNDDASIPSHALPLGAILRLSPPPIDLATDYMLVLAGREGHILKRDAVTSLYNSKGHDLRASITELNFWCQMSVGDRKGGLEWMFQRWPPGNDVDEQGRLLRVASEDTYLPGMGCLSHNVFETSNNTVFDKQDELIKESWADWGMDPSDWSAGNGHIKVPSKPTDETLLASLKRLDTMSDSISAADAYCRIDLPSYEQAHDQPTEPTLPPLREKERLNYTISDRVIQTDHITDFSNFDTDMFVQSHMLILRTYGDLRSSLGAPCPIPTTETSFTQAILKHKQSTLTTPFLTRKHFEPAFDVLAYIPDTLPSVHTSYNLNASAFAGTFRIVVEDVAPYVRSIIAHEQALDAQRLRLANLLSEGGRGAGTKRARTTRAARTALEGGERKSKRRERWFDKDLNRLLVMRTAGKTWSGLGAGAGTGMETEGSEKTGGSPSASQDV